MAEINKENSAARLAALKKCAAADRSAARRMMLAKCAGVLDTLVGSGKAPYDSGVIPKLLANEDLRRALVGAAGAGTAAAVTSDKKNRWRNALLAAAAGGAGTYGLSAAGTLDNFFSPYSDINAHAKGFLRDQHAREITRLLRGPDKGSMYEKVRSFIENSPFKQHGVTITT